MKKAALRKARIDRPVIEKGVELEAVVFGPVKRPLNRSELQSALGPVVRAWLGATCQWDELAIGDYRFVVFAFSPTPKVEVYVQFWSEPMEPVAWEVSSGRWHGPRDKWLAGRTQRIEAFGFTLADGTENYTREVWIRSSADMTRVAREVVDIFYDAFDYRGQQPFTAKLVHEGRAEEQPVFNAFTPEDVSKLFAASGFRVEEAVTDDGEMQDPPALRCRKRGLFTIVEFDDQVEGENLYRRLRFSADLPASAEEVAALGSPPPDAPEGAEPVVSISVVHPVGGGVTLAWLIERIGEWDAVIAARWRELRPGRRRRAVIPDTVH